MPNKLGSENVFPIIRVLEDATPPSTPPTGQVHFYVDEATKTLHGLDDADVDTDYGASAITDIVNVPTAETDTALVLHPDGAGGVEWGPDATGGGGAASTFPLDAYLTSSGSARNDEFDDGPGIDGKWTLAGNALDDTDENNDYPERLLLRRNDTGSKISIYYQDLPSFPCDIVTHVAASTYAADYARAGGLAILPATPSDSSPALYTGLLYNGGRKYESALYSNLSTYASTPAGASATGALANGMWVRVTILSGGTTADLYWSADGYFWTLAASAVALGFTAANAGIGIAPEGQAADLLALFDYYRVSA
jgi:hypothetical protein